MKRLLCLFLSAWVCMSSAMADGHWLKRPSDDPRYMGDLDKALNAMIEGDIPPDWVGKRLRFTIDGSRNHPFPIVFFMSHIPGPLEGRNWGFLSPSEYEALVRFAMAKKCVTPERSRYVLQHEGGDVLGVTEFDNSRM